MKKISIEEHISLPELADIRNKYIQETKFPIDINDEARNMERRLLQDIEELRIPEMDRNGITMQILSSGPSVQLLHDPKEAAIKAAEANDYVAEVVKKYPSHFAAMAQLPLQDPKQAVAELERAVTQLGLKGVMVYGHTHGEYLDEKKFWGIWERAEALGVPIYLHPAHSLPDQLKIYHGRSELLGPVWNWGIDTGTQALRIIFSGLFDAFPKATLIIGHMGEMIPYALWRMDNRWKSQLEGRSELKVHDNKIKNPPSQYMKDNVMITTSGNFSANVLTFAINEIGADRILFAVDYPHESNAIASEFIENAPISEEDRKKICYENAEKLFNL